VNEWKKTFLTKLHAAQEKCAHFFDESLERHVLPVFDELQQFLRDNDFDVTSPMKEKGRRSFKFELAENAYLLVIFRFAGVDEFELRNEIFVPCREPILEKFAGRVADIDRDWAENLLQTSLDRFVDLLNEQKAEKPEEELAAV
jgi:hypothetical protein